MHLYLIRHAQTAWNKLGQAQGHTDIPLDETGEEQARRLGESFRNRPIVKVYTSDLTRSRMTAQAVVNTTGATLIAREDLRERSFGDWEGSNFTWVTQQLALAAEEQDISLSEVRPPNGESFMDVWDRLQKVRDDLFSETEETVVVTHGGACSILLARLLMGTLQTSRGFRFANTSVTTLEKRPEGAFLMTKYDDASHLGDLEIRRIHGNLDGTHK